MPGSASLRAAVLFAVLGGAGACTGAEQAAEAPEVLVEAQRVRGEVLYRQYCEACHEAEGAIGVELSARVLASYYTARSLHDYIDLAMPYNEPGSMGEVEYWDVTAFLVADRALARIEAPLTAATADSVRLTWTPPP